MAQTAEKFLLNKLSRVGFLALLAITVLSALFGQPMASAAAAAGAGLILCDPAFHQRRQQPPWPLVQRLFFLVLALLVIASLRLGPWALGHWLYALPLVAFALFPLAVASLLSLALCVLALTGIQWSGPLPERHQITSAFLLTLLLSGLLVFLREYKSRQLAPLRRTDELTQAASREYLSADLHKEIQRSERERKELKGIQKIARERAKKSKVHNRKLRDCRVHLNTKDKNKFKSTLFITEGDSASGSITKARDVQFQAVFSLKGKPLNSFGLTRKVVYENEEFNLIQAALGIEEDLEDLRYNQVVIATDADVDGMHIRLLLITFFLQFFPELIRQGHLFVLQTPLFRVRNKKSTLYCYDDTEREAAIKTLGKNPEITRFKGLGEISPDEFKHFISEDIRLDPVKIDAHESIKEMLKFFMGKNTPERQEYIIRNLRFEHDLVDEEESVAEEVITADKEEAVAEKSEAA